jgi:hypothetical protein
MKKIFLAFAGGLFPVLAILNVAHAQNSKDTVIYAQNEKKASGIKNLNPLNSADAAANGGGAANNIAADIKTISSKAIKNFKIEFGKADPVKWFKLSNGFVAYCTVNSIQNKAYYDRKGNWLYSTRYYEEKDLPKDVRAIVRSTYYDYSISGIQEIHVDDKTVYLVYVKDETTWKTLRVCNGEMEVLATFKNDL